MSRKVLLVEDDPNLGLITAEHLQMNGFDVTRCVDGIEGLKAFGAASFDLCLIDVMMPRKDGFTLAAEIRQLNSTVPLIFLTARSLKDDKIKGFKTGCDDYITKPFSVEELLLRIQAVLRRTQSTLPEETTRFELASYSFDSAKRVLKSGKQEFRLTPRESDLLRLFCLHQNQVLSRTDALEKLWGEENYFSGRSMDVFVSKLRKYLADDDRIEISNIHGKGFRLTIS